MSETTPNTLVSTDDSGMASPPTTSPPTATDNSSRASSMAGTAIRGLPTLLVLAALAGLAWWGHHHGWTLPQFSELMYAPEETGIAWCDEHGVPEEDCIACDADLLPKGELLGWCNEHGVHECVLHHPQLSQLDPTPDINQEDFERAGRAIAARPRTKNDPSCKMHLRRIQFPSIAAVDRAGIDIGLVDRGPVVETIKTTGEIVYDPTLVAKVSSRAAGTAFDVEGKIGDHVKKGDVLALIDAVEVGRAKSQLLDSLVQLELTSKTLDRLSRLGGTVIAGRQIESAKANQAAADVAVRKAIQTLSNLGLPIAPEDVFGKPVTKLRAEIRFLGIPESLRNALGPIVTSSNLIPVVAPRDGIVVQRDVVAGEVIDSGTPLFTVADTKQMWLLLRLRLEEAERVLIGQKVVFRPDGSREELTGTVTWISTDVDRETRTIKIRGQIPNPDGRLKNETFGAGEIVLREEPDAIVVPNNAIHWEGCCHIAFVRDKDYFKDGSYKVFHTRSVRPGATVGDLTEVIAGLLPGEVIVTKGSGILRAELLKGNLGAG